MNILEYLTRAGVPAHYHADAIASIESARDRASGLLWIKFVARYIKAGNMARAVVDRKVVRASDANPDFARYDVEPVANINAFGDNAVGLVGENVYVQTEGSPEYLASCKRNYWTTPKHTVWPGTYESVKAQYRRNGGAAEAYARGEVVFPEVCQSWEADGVKVYHSPGIWQIVTKDKWLGFIPVRIRIGYEIDNVVNVEKKTAKWTPFAGRPLRAPVTWSVRPGSGK